METPQEEPRTPTERPNRQDSVIGPFAAIVIVIILLALGGLYFFIEQATKIHSQELPAQEQLNS